MHAPITAALTAFALIAPATTAKPAILIHGEPASPKVKVANLILAAVQSGKPRSLAGLVTPDAKLAESFDTPKKLTPAALAKVLSACQVDDDDEDLRVGKDFISLTLLCPVEEGGPRYGHVVEFDFRGGKVSEISFTAMVEPPAPPAPPRS